MEISAVPDTRPAGRFPDRLRSDTLHSVFPAEGVQGGACGTRRCEDRMLKVHVARKIMRTVLAERLNVLTPQGVV
jgi:hypothetical protein